MTYQALDIKSSPGQQLVVDHAERASRTANSLRLLAGLATPIETTGR